MSDHPVVIIGAGMGGLTAAMRLARRGIAVQVVEARPVAGGLAAPVSFAGRSFDAGPYILLDRPGLTWAFEQLGLDLAGLVNLRPIEHPYEVTATDGVVAIHREVERTAGGFERRWPGSAKPYHRFVAEITLIHPRLQPLLHISRPGLGALIACGGWRHIRFLRRSLGEVLRASRLPGPVIQALGIWTHVAGQSLNLAPSPMAFVPALIHGPGAWYPVGGIGAVVEVLVRALERLGVPIRFSTRVSAIRTAQGAVRGVELVDGGFIAAERVLSDVHGVGTYCDLVPAITPRVKRRLAALPLQSPGVCIYLTGRVRAATSPAPYLRFQLPDDAGLCRLLVQPSVVVPKNENVVGMRLIAPMRHAEAQAMGAVGQQAFAERLLAEPWWRAHVDDAQVLHIRTPSEWGATCHLHRDSMNPVMTAAFMRAGRLAHRSPYVDGLHLAGSSTHPGQWLSFCAMSGILAADEVPK